MFSKNRYMVIIKKIHMKGSYTFISLYNAMTASMTVCVMKRKSLPRWFRLDLRSSCPNFSKCWDYRDVPPLLARILKLLP